MQWFIALLALSLLVIIHEFGHYICARASGMHVRRFSLIGIGPVILRLFEYKGTEFVISAIPFGAYVQISGMESEDDAPGTTSGARNGDDARPDANLEDGPEDSGPARDGRPTTSAPDPRASQLYRDKPLWARFLAIAGGPLANYLAAILIVVGVFATVGVNRPVSVKLDGFGAASPAQAAGLEVGDIFVAVAGESVRGYPQAEQLSAITKQHLGKSVEITVERDGETLALPVRLNPQAPALGISLSFGGDYIPVSLGEAVTRGLKWPFQLTGRQLSGLWRIITREEAGRVGGPVAIARAIKAKADQGPLDLLLFTAFISTLLGMFNLLPLPALDGGRLIFLIFEFVARRPANRRVEEWVHAAGMVGLLGLLGYATLGDVRGEKTPPWSETTVEFRALMAKERGAADRAAIPATTPTSDPEN
ncbi:MAG: M50 family metallopeptidase [Nannocystaceae bacterium]